MREQAFCNQCFRNNQGDQVFAISVTGSIRGTSCLQQVFQEQSGGPAVCNQLQEQSGGQAFCNQCYKSNQGGQVFLQPVLKEQSGGQAV